MFRTATTTLIFLLCFVAAPLGAVALHGGGNLTSRIQRWHTLNTSIQSTDIGRESIDNAEKDVALLASFLAPGPEAAQRARAYYEVWRADKQSPIVQLELKDLQFEGDSTARTTHALAVLKDGVARHGARVSRWERHKGIWYLAESEDTF